MQTSEHTHVTAQELILLADERHDVAQHQRLWTHIAECSACAEELRLLKEIEGAARDLPRILPSTDFVDEVMARCDADAAVSAKRTRWGTVRAWKSVWIGVVGFAVVGVLVWIANGSTNSGAIVQDQLSDDSGFSDMLYRNIAEMLNTVQGLLQFVSGEVWSALMILLLSLVILNAIDAVATRKRLKLD